MQQRNKFECQIVTHSNPIDISVMSPIRVFFLYHPDDKIFFELFKELFIPEYVIIVNDDNNTLSEVSSSGKIIEKVDFFISLISNQLLHNITLLKMLINNYEKSKKFIMLIIDKFIYDTENRLKIYHNWKVKKEKFESQVLDNDEVYNYVKTLEKAIAMLPNHLDLLSLSIVTATDKLTYLINELYTFVRTRFNTDVFFKYKEDTELKKFLYDKENLIERSSTMNVTTQTAEKIINIEAEKVIMGDYKQSINDIDSIKSLIESIRQESSVLNSTDIAKLTCALDDINSSINKLNDINARARMSNALTSISSLCTIASFAPTLHQHMQELLNKFTQLLP